MDWPVVPGGYGEQVTDRRHLRYCGEGVICMIVNAVDLREPSCYESGAPTRRFSVGVALGPVYPLDCNDIVLFARVIHGRKGLASDKLANLGLHRIEPIRPIRASLGLIECGWVREDL
jgi:hypothetical protein